MASSSCRRHSNRRCKRATKASASYVKICAYCGVTRPRILTPAGKEMEVGTGCGPLPWGRRRYGARTRDIHCFEIGRAHDLQVFHVRRIVEEIMRDAGPLVDTIACGDQRFFI